MEAVLTRPTFRLGLLGLLVVYLCGWIAPLFENDSAQFAVMAMRMVQEGEFLALFKGPDPYLDKPHMHYWIAAWGMKVFGIHSWAYRLSGLVAAALAAVSVHGLGTMLYSRSVGRLATWIFLSCQTIVLSLTDLRTDAWLTAFTAFAIWQWAVYNRYASVRNLLFCALGTGLAFSTKGHIALVIVGSAVLSDVLYTRRWKSLFTPWLFVAIGVFALAISPVLYAYYQQFDLHPELVIRGRSERSGVWFILWEQSFERMSGEGIGKNSPDYFFFFHTFLWVFLPWTLFGLLAIYSRTRTLLLSRFRQLTGREFLTLGTVLIVFPLISAAQFKLPHYLNILMPVTAILTASLLSRPGLYRSPRNRALLNGLAAGVFALALAAVWLIVLVVFPFRSWTGFLWLLPATAVGLLLVVSRSSPCPKLWYVAMYTSLFLNFTLNLHFYPRLLEYQSGSSMAKWVRQQEIPKDRIYKISDTYTWAMDFYLRNPVARIEEEQVSALPAGSYLYLNPREWERLSDRGFQKVHEVDNFRITRLSLKFLNPESRVEVLDKRFLVRKN